MGFSVLKIRENYNNAGHKEWLIDTDDELNDIPIDKCSPGSEAYSAESGTRWILGNDKEWKEKVISGDGGDGQDGFSPTVTVTDIVGGHRLTITDVNGATTVDVMDGVDGQNGTNGTNGNDGSNGTTFTPSVSSAGVISWTNDGGLTNPASVDLVTAVIQAVKPAVTTVTGTAPSITLADNTIFSAGTLTSLTVTGSLNEGQIAVIVFTSGSTATQLTMPSTIKMPDSFAVETNKIYEISITGNRGAVQSWSTT